MPVFRQNSPVSAEGQKILSALFNITQPLKAYLAATFNG